MLTSGFNRDTAAPARPSRSSRPICLPLRDRCKRRAALQTLQVPNSFGGNCLAANAAVSWSAGGWMMDFICSPGAARNSYARPDSPGPQGGLGADVQPQAQASPSAPTDAAPGGELLQRFREPVDLAARKSSLSRTCAWARSIAQSGAPGGQLPFAVAWTDASHAWVSSACDRQLVALSVSAAGLRVTVRVRTIGQLTALPSTARRTGGCHRRQFGPPCLRRY